jgi:hypothetical protein
MRITAIRFGKAIKQHIRSVLTKLTSTIGNDSDPRIAWEYHNPHIVTVRAADAKCSGKYLNWSLGQSLFCSSARRVMTGLAGERYAHR